MSFMMNRLLNARLEESDIEEDQTNEQEETNEETKMVLWDWVPTLGMNEEEPNKDIQVSPVNVTTRSKGPVVDESLVLPKIQNIKENMKKILSTTQTTHKSNLVNIKETNPIVNKPVKAMVNKIEGTKKGL